MALSTWTARDWRKLLVLLLLSGGGVALTALAALRLVPLVAARSLHDPWPLAYALYAVLAGVGIVLVGLGWALGKSSITVSAGPVSGSISGGEEES